MGRPARRIGRESLGVDDRPDTDISRYPMHRMVAVLDDETGVRTALEELAERGIDRSEIVVLTGQEGLTFLDPGGEQHGLFGRLLRLLQITAEEGNALQFHQQALSDGKSVLYVAARGEAQKDAASAALSAAGGHHLAYFGRWTVERPQG